MTTVNGFKCSINEYHFVTRNGIMSEFRTGLPVYYQISGLCPELGGVCDRVLMDTNFAKTFQRPGIQKSNLRERTCVISVLSLNN